MSLYERLHAAESLNSHRTLIATIKNMGQFPCPCCFIQLAEIPDLGKAVDDQRRADTRAPSKGYFSMVKKARKAIFNGFKVSGTRVERMIGGLSRVPTVVSAFCNCHCG